MRRIVAFVLALALAACGGGATAPKTPSVSGHWTGTANAPGGLMSVDLTLVEQDGMVTGNGAISGALAIAVTVIGTHSHPNVALVLHPTGSQDLSFSGTMGTDNAITGQLVGSGLLGVPLTLGR